MKKILVLEDEANIRSFVVINLNRAGYETIEAGSGEERNSSHCGSRPGSLTMRYQAGVMNMEMRNTMIRSSRR